MVWQAKGLDRRKASPFGEGEGFELLVYHSVQGGKIRVLVNRYRQTLPDKPARPWPRGHHPCICLGSPRYSIELYRSQSTLFLF